MDNGAILDYSGRIREKLRGSAYRPVPKIPGGIDMYQPIPAPAPGPDFDPAAPFTACYVLAWSKEMEAERKAWENLIATAQTSIKLTYPGANVLTSDLGSISQGVAFPIVVAQVYAVFRRSVRGNLMFLDADVLAYNRTDPFALDFDVGLTDCEDLWPMQPFNAGVQFVKDTPGAQLFCDTAAELAAACPGNMQPWYAYQLAMRIAYDMLKDRVKFVVFPYDRFNFTPESDFEETDAYFVHSRGQRKALQFEYFRRLKARSDA